MAMTLGAKLWPSPFAACWPWTPLVAANVGLKVRWWLSEPNECLIAHGPKALKMDARKWHFSGERETWTDPTRGKGLIEKRGL